MKPHLEAKLDMDTAMEELDIVIVGGGICGLAFALALHRKGVRSVVLERSETLRATGAGIAVLTNGWRALDELGVASKLRHTSLPIQRVWDVDHNSGKQRQAPVSMGEARCVRRSDLINALANDLPLNTVRFGCEIFSVTLDEHIALPILRLSDGSFIRTKVLIGCDGANSIVADFLGLKPKKIFRSCAVRGFTNYSNGHGFSPELTRIRKGNILCGRAPVDHNLVFWFVVDQKLDTKDSKDHSRYPELIRELALESIKGFSTERIQMIENCDLTSLSLTHLRYRAPWDVLLGKFHKGTVTVAGDAMHVMGPFLGQGGSAGLEDAIVLARCLTQMIAQNETCLSQTSIPKIGEAFDQYVKERRMRLVWLSTQTYLIGSLLDTSSMHMKILIIVILVALFRNPIYHTRYDCGRL